MAFVARCLLAAFLHQYSDGILTVLIASVMPSLSLCVKTHFKQMSEWSSLQLLETKSKYCTIYIAWESSAEMVFHIKFKCWLQKLIISIREFFSMSNPYYPSLVTTVCNDFIVFTPSVVVLSSPCIAILFDARQDCVILYKYISWKCGNLSPLNTIGSVQWF